MGEFFIPFVEGTQVLLHPTPDEKSKKRQNQQGTECDESDDDPRHADQPRQAAILTVPITVILVKMDNVDPESDGCSATTYLFDLDGTLLVEELIPAVAEASGHGALIRAATERAMAGVEPFDDNLRRRVEVLSEVPLETVHEVLLSLPITASLMDWVSSRKDRVRVVTSNLDLWVQPWLDQHGLIGYTSKASLVDGRVRLERILHKEEILTRFADNRTVMVGDGANDAAIMADADFAIAYSPRRPVPTVLAEVADVILHQEEALCRTLSQL